MEVPYFFCNVIFLSQITGDIFWVESGFEALKSSCEFEAVKNYTAYEKDEEGNLVPPKKVTIVAFKEIAQTELAFVMKDLFPLTAQ